jgi:crotonobetainyl-CoA:carnitine CoA-transferase CaiB-like acyl-CoA transferase
MGPMATQILGDLGADVITIESGRGDTNRAMGTGPHRQLSDISLNLLRNKRNVALDLKRDEGRAALLRIAQTCDVFVTNLRPAPLRRLRLTYDDLVAVRADIVYCQAQGYPSDGPRADDPAYDDVIQANAGVADAARRATGEPTLAPTLLADKVSGLTLTYAVLAALFHRERTGEGQRVEVPMTDALTAFLLVEHGSGGMSTPVESGAGYQRILTPLRRAARTADGWISVFPYLDQHWVVILEAAGATHLAPEGGITRESLADDPGARYRILEEILPAKTTEEWLAICSRAEIPAAEARDLDDVIASLPDDEHPVAGAHKRIPPPVRLSGSPASVRRPAPLIGEHNREVLREVGLDDAEIDALAADGVIRTRGSISAR